MSTFWKVMIGLVLALPVAAYVAGTLAGSSADVRDRRAPIVIEDKPTPDATRPPSTTPTPSSPPTTQPDDPETGLVRPTPFDVEDDWDEPEDPDDPDDTGDTDDTDDSADSADGDDGADDD